MSVSTANAAHPQFNPLVILHCWKQQQSDHSAVPLGMLQEASRQQGCPAMYWELSDSCRVCQDVRRNVPCVQFANCRGSEPPASNFGPAQCVVDAWVALCCSLSLEVVCGELHFFMYPTLILVCVCFATAEYACCQSKAIIAVRACCTIESQQHRVSY